MFLIAVVIVSPRETCRLRTVGLWYGRHFTPTCIRVHANGGATLLPLIRAHAAPGTIIHSDEWASYSQIATRFPHLQHHTVNHSVEFVNPTTGVHTQHIESYWNRVKKRFKSMKGVNSLQLPSYLDEFMWRERYGSTSQEAFNSVLRDISLQYIV